MRINTFNDLWNTHLVAPLLSGLLLIAAFPPFEQGYMAWFALLPLIATCLDAPPSRAFRAGFTFGLPVNLYLNLYLTGVLFTYLPGYLALAAMAGLVLFISLFYALFGLAVSLASRLNRAWFTALAVPSLWLLIEYLRSVGFLGYNVGYIGYTQWGYPPLLNLAALYGYWGLPFMIVFFQTLLLLIFRKKLAGIERCLLPSLFVILLAAGLIMPNFEPVEAAERPLPVGLIQGNTAPEQVIDGDKEAVKMRYLEMTAQAIEREPLLEMIVWPETVVALDFSTEKNHPREMERLAREKEVTIIYGARIKEAENLFNAITLIDPKREEIIVYHKQRLVPFVEYFPLEKLLNRILNLDLLLGRYTAGEEIIIFKVGKIPLGGVICFESYFGDHTRLFAAKGARHLFVLTNDAWFGTTIGLEQHAQAAAIRAAEAGIGVTQVANGGITISFDYRGRELFRSGKQVEEIITATLDLESRKTIYSRCGDYFPAFWALFLGFAVPFLLSRPTSKNP